MLRDRRELRVGLLVVGAAVLLGIGTLLIGKDERLFGRKAHYWIRFESVSGLRVGNPVQLNGVVVGRVSKVVLPEDMGQNQITVWVAIDRGYEQRIRGDSSAKLKTLGLLGDRYVEIHSGSPDFPQIPRDGEIPAASGTNVDQLLASGEDVMQNVVSISHSLSSILERIDRGEGVLGEITSKNAESEKLKAKILAALDSIQEIGDDVHRSQGPIGRLIRDRQLGDNLASAVDHLSGALGKLDTGRGILPALLDDPASKQKLDATLDGLQRAAQELGAVATDLRQGEGIVPKLLHDKQYSEEVAGRLRDLIDKLDTIATKLESGDGTAARLINDPSVYEAVQDILVGVDESRMLRWLVRNRQKAGIRHRYFEQHGLETTPPRPAGPAGPSPTPAPKPPR
ncbi:MAG: MlaD family protein [Acidobacteriota bacterium]